MSSTRIYHPSPDISSVYTLLGIESAHSSFATHELWYYAITGWGNVSRLNSPSVLPWSAKFLALPGGIGRHKRAFAIDITRLIV